MLQTITAIFELSPRSFLTSQMPNQFNTKDHMKYFQLTFLFALIIFLGLFRVVDASDPDSPVPNVIIFYVDDLGWQDIELNDLDDPCPYETPNIKRLAQAGMNFTQAYSPAPTCSPSRAGIISGQHPAKIRLTHVDLGIMKPGRTTDRLMPPYLQSHLDLDILTIADAMNQNGYRTGHVGKMARRTDRQKLRF